MGVTLKIGSLPPKSGDLAALIMYILWYMVQGRISNCYRLQICSESQHAPSCDLMYVCVFTVAQKYPVTDQQLDAMITDEHINNICLFLPRWEDIANQLKIDQLEIDDIKRTCGSTTITATNHRVLSKWKRENGSKAICRELVGVLDILLERDCAESVCEVICH